MTPDVLPPSDLTPESFASDLYDALAPLAREDPYNAWALLILCNAIGTLFQLVDEWVRDGPDGPGWSLLVDLDRCPSEALPWLGQFVGVRLPVGLTDAAQRAYIKAAPGFRRGTKASMIAAAQATLTGTQTVTVKEQDTDPYIVTVTTLASETPSVPATRNALLSQKPAGLILNYGGSGVSQTWNALKSGTATWALCKTKYTSWDRELLNLTP